MINSYILVAFRNLLKHRTFSFINIFGLSVSLVGCMVIALYIYEETRYDSYHADSERIYRVTRKFMSPDGSTSLELGSIAPPFAPLLVNDYEEIASIVRLSPMASASITLENSKTVYAEPNFLFTDSTIFEVFSIDLLSGDPETALAQPGSVIISESTAKKYFGEQEAMGRTIRFWDQYNMKVTGVFKEFPAESHMHPTLLGDMQPVIEFYGGREAMMQNWGGNNFFTYMKLHSDASIETIEADLINFVNRHINDDASSWTNLGIQRLTDIHLHSHLDSELEANGDIRYIYTFAGIALLILLIACINYMNLSTARATSRAKEVGLRKVMGAYRAQLVRQFLIESTMLVLIAVLLASGLLSLVLPYFRDLTGNTFELNAFNSLGILAGLTLVAILIGLLSGSYPAFFLSRFQPSRVLKGEITTGQRASYLRRVLVVTQFSISVVLIFSTVIIMQQVDYMKQKNLGFNKEEVVIIPQSRLNPEEMELFRNRLLEHAAIKTVSYSSRVPSIRLLDSSGAEAELEDEMVKPDVVIKNLRADHQFVEVYEIPLLAGRNFDQRIQSDDTGAYLINAVAASMIGYASPKEAINKRFSYDGVPGKIIGVMQDIHFESLSNAIGPLVVHQRLESSRNISVKVDAAATPEALTHLREVWSQMQAAVPFEYRFLDDRFEALYEAESVRSSLFTGFSFMAISLACLGLLGLASFTVSKRYKEINIRKVLGAPIGSLLLLLSKEFLLLIVLSFGLAFPAGIYFMADWLDSYAYRIDIGVLPYVLAALIAIFTALITITAQTLKAVRVNPAIALRDE